MRANKFLVQKKKIVCTGACVGNEINSSYWNARFFAAIKLVVFANSLGKSYYKRMRGIEIKEKKERGTCRGFLYHFRHVCLLSHAITPIHSKSGYI